MERLVKRVGTGNAVPTKFDMDFVFGLDIETFHGIQKIFNQLCNLTDILGDNCDLDRLRELVEADRDGRCVVLPCKEGAILQRDGFNFEADHWNILLSAFADDPSTKSGHRLKLFSVEEAAEAALKGEAYGG